VSEAKRSSKLIGVGAAAVSMVLMASACGNGGGVSTGPEEGEGADSKNISIGIIPWEDDIAVTHLWKVILEEKGYNVTLENADVAPVFEGTSNGDIDLYMDVWLPNTHGEYWEQYGDKLEDLGAWNEGASLELTVPSYMEDVNSIEDLKGEAGTFDGEIIGIESGAGLTQTTKSSVIPEYGLESDYKLVESSTPAMLEALGNAIKEKEPIVVTLWHPHIVYAQQDLKDLEDPKGAMGKPESLHSVGRSGFSEDFPDVAKWLGDFKLTSDQIVELEEQVILKHEDDKDAGAEAWLAENPDFLKKAMGKEAKGLDFGS